MNRHRIITLVLLSVLAMLPLAHTEAGGWASVRIVDDPGALEAGTPVTLHLIIEQHGITPIDIDPLVITATSADSDASVEETAAKADGVGNYTVELTFPSDGIWDLTGTPGGFPPFDMGTIDIGQPAAASAISAPSGAVVVTISGGMGSGQFEPSRIEIAKGTLVVWQNDSVEGHSVIVDGDKLRSGLIAPGAAFAIRFDDPGTYRVSCGPHPNMTATIVVE
jgi:plastocyanin